MVRLHAWNPGACLAGSPGIFEGTPGARWHDMPWGTTRAFVTGCHRPTGVLPRPVMGVIRRHKAYAALATLTGARGHPDALRVQIRVESGLILIDGGIRRRQC